MENILEQKITNVFTKKYNKENYIDLLEYIFTIDKIKENTETVNNIKINLLGKANGVYFLEAELETRHQLEYARTLQRDTIQKYFKDIKQEPIAEVIVVFYSKENKDDWRFSLINLYLEEVEQNGKRKLITATSKATRQSFLVGENEGIRTLLEKLITFKRDKNPTNTCNYKKQDIKEIFNVEKTSEEFFREISKWYEKAIEDLHFPALKNTSKILNKNLEEELKPQVIIRIITRLMFMWFLKKKDNLVPDLFFKKDIIDKYLKDKNTYYNAILQNLFFAVLNQPIDRRRFKNEDKEKRFNAEANERGVSNLFRYKDLFKSEELANDFLEETKKIPYVNGGLFTCHDFQDENSKTQVRIDGFSANKNERSILSDEIFFNKEENGIIDILNRYNFTIEETTPLEKDIALDPELLGEVFENLLACYNPETRETARKESGSYYTPRVIVNYMIKESLKEYLKNELTSYNETEIDKLLDYESIEKIELKDSEKTEIKEKLLKIKIIDPACGSGAFPMGALNMIILAIEKMSNNEKITYDDKLEIIKNCIYGVDIQNIAVEISKLRFFISLLIDTEIDKDNKDGNYGFKTLPNLETKFVCANSLVDIELPAEPKKELDDFETAMNKAKGMLNLQNMSGSGDFYKRLRQVMNKIREQYLTADNYIDKNRLKKEFEVAKGELLEYCEKNLTLDRKENMKKTVDLLKQWNPFDISASCPFFNKEWMFDCGDGFDVVIGNPPYVSNKSIDKEAQKEYKNIYGISEDLYNYFFIRGNQILKNGGILSYITSNTFLTIESKANIREMLLSNKLLYLLNLGGGVFNNAVVSTAITIYSKRKVNNYNFKYCEVIDKTLTFNNYIDIDVNIYKNTINNVFFTPNEYNMNIYNLYNNKIKELYDNYWDKISSAKNIEKNNKELEVYRNNLKAGDITLLGLITDGGQGLATANNGKYIAVLNNTKLANDIKEKRIKKLKEFNEKKKVLDIIDYKSFLNNKTEKEIAELFDNLKEEYGRDIFGQGFLYKIITEKDIANIDLLTEKEKTNGIDKEKPHYVLYDKGDKDGNRWYLKSPYYIAWNKENVEFLKENSGKKGQGMPVVRNQQFYFKEGFCWSDISDTRIKCRIKNKSINDVASMSLYSYNNLNFYICSLINSTFIGKFVKTFINASIHFQINDARLLPIIIPNEKQLKIFERIFNEACALQKSKFDGVLSEWEVEEKLTTLQVELDAEVEKLYGVDGRN